MSTALTSLPVSTTAAHSMFDDSPVTELSDGELGERLTGYAGQIAALTARFLELLAEFDRRRAWCGSGIVSCAQWLSWRTGLAMRTAQDHVRVAHALCELPRMRAEFAAGRLSYSKVRALTRVATTDRDNELVNVALSATAAQVERLVRSMRRIDRRTGEQATGTIESAGRWRWNDDGSLSVTLRLAPLDGARFLAGAVRAEYERTRTATDADVPRNAQLAAEAQPAESRAVDQERHPDLWRHVPADIAPAVVAMADAVRDVVAMPEVAPGAEVLVHVPDADADLDPGRSPDAHLDAGPALAAAEVGEARCGASVREVGESARGVTLRWGRKRRVPNAALVRVITGRDRGCRHPGCGRTRYLHVHHVRPWSEGGTTDADNLILLCSTHHRALHRGEYSITAHGGQRFTFVNQRGAPIDPSPPVAMPSGSPIDPHVAGDAAVPVGGGRLDLGYTTEVLYAIWNYTMDRADAA